jgi:hypothetical protein
VILKSAFSKSMRFIPRFRQLVEIAAAKGQHDLADALLEMESSEAARDFLEWSEER